jgi:hypothetical protein
MSYLSPEACRLSSLTLLALDGNLLSFLPQEIYQACPSACKTSVALGPRRRC